ncbi:MAG: hypothetical protein U0746_23060 [Gemmataceae bacterium]
MSRFRCVLLALYLADFALLAWLVPHRPAVSFNVGDWYSGPLGFSPDGTLFATATRCPLDAEEYDVRLWDIAGRPWFGPPRLVAERHFDRLAHLGWNWPDDPGRRWLFWQCALADDPQARADELYPGVGLDAERLDPTETPPRFRASADGRYYLLRVPIRRFEVRVRDGGRVLWTTPQVETTPVFGPGPDELTVLEPTDAAGRAAVVRYELSSGREAQRVAVKLPKDGRHVVRDVRLTPDGRYVGAIGGGERHALVLCEVATGAQIAATGQFLAVRWIDPPGRLVANRLALRRETNAEFWTLGRETPVATVDPPTGHFDYANLFAEASPDGSAVAFLTSRPRSATTAGWPPWLAWLYRRFVHTDWDSATLALHAMADGRSLGTIEIAHGGPNRVTGEGVAAFSPDGRWLAVRDTELTVRNGVHMSGEAVVRVYQYPLRRPWPWILAWAAAPPVGLALLVAGVRLWRAQPRAAVRSSPSLLDREEPHPPR